MTSKSTLRSRLRRPRPHRSATAARHRDLCTQRRMMPGTRGPGTCGRPRSSTGSSGPGGTAARPGQEYRACAEPRAQRAPSHWPARTSPMGSARRGHLEPDPDQVGHRLDARSTIGSHTPGPLDHLHADHPTSQRVKPGPARQMPGRTDTRPAAAEEVNGSIFGSATPTLAGGWPTWR